MLKLELKEVKTKEENSQLPIVEVELLTFEKSKYQRGNCIWKAETLYKAAEKQGCVEFDLPIAGIEITTCGFKIITEDAVNIAEHILRIVNTDLKYPVILDDNGYIADGWHRVVKALVEKRPSIKAIRLKEMPEPDTINQEEKN